MKDLREYAPRWSSGQRRMVLVIVAAVVIVVAVISIALLVLSHSGDEESDERMAMAQGVPIETAVVTLGGRCDTGGLAGRAQCSYGQMTFVLWPNSWETKAGQRERECRMQQVAEGTEVLTNYRWVVTADDSAALATLRTDLARVGTPSKIMGYCEWDEQG